MAGRNAQERWGAFLGGCDLQIEIGILIFALSVRHAVPCLRQVRRIATRIPPDAAKNYEDRGMNGETMVCASQGTVIYASQGTEVSEAPNAPSKDLPTTRGSY